MLSSVRTDRPIDKRNRSDDGSATRSGRKPSQIASSTGADEVRIGSPYGATTIAGDVSRQPTPTESAGARHQGGRIAETAAQLRSREDMDMAQSIVGPTRHPVEVAGRASASLLDTASYRIDSVTLVVRDLDGLARFYRDAIGLAPISREADLIRLGVGSTVLLELRRDAAARPWSPREAGLHHTAFLLPSREHLGAWLVHATERGIRLSGASDHLVSEAIYLDDPEGNGIEVYADRPSSVWSRQEDGSIVMRTDRLDNAALMRAASGRWAGMPSGGRVGHVHLQVGEIDPADRFYVGLLGFDVMMRCPGATFLGAGGYHHQLATNVWHSRGARGRAADVAGLAEVVLLADAPTLAAVRNRCRDAGLTPDEADGALALHDPWGSRIRLVPNG